MIVLLLFLSFLQTILAASHRVSFSKINDQTEFNNTVVQIQKILLPILSSDTRPENAIMSRTLSLVSPLLEILCEYSVESESEIYYESNLKEIQKFRHSIAMIMNYSEISILDSISLNIFLLRSCTIEIKESIESISWDIFVQISENENVTGYKYDYFNCFIRYFKPEISFSQIKRLSTLAHDFLPNELDSFILGYSEKILKYFLQSDFEIGHVFNLLYLASRNDVKLGLGTIQKLYFLISIGLNRKLTETTAFNFLAILKDFRIKIQEGNHIIKDSSILGTETSESLIQFADVVSCNGFWSIGREFCEKNKEIERVYFLTMYPCLRHVTITNIDFLSHENMEYFDKFTALIHQQTKRIQLISDNLNRMSASRHKITEESLKSSLKSLEFISLSIKFIYDDKYLDSIGKFLFKFNSTLIELVDVNSNSNKSLKDSALLNSYLAVKILKIVHFSCMPDYFTLFMAKIAGRLFTFMYSTSEEIETVNRIIRPNDVFEFITELLGHFESKTTILDDEDSYSFLSACINTLPNSQSLKRRLSVCFIEHFGWNSFKSNFHAFQILQLNHINDENFTQVLKFGFLKKLLQFAFDQKEADGTKWLYGQLCLTIGVFTKTEHLIIRQILLK